MFLLEPIAWYFTIHFYFLKLNFFRKIDISRFLTVLVNWIKNIMFSNRYLIISTISLISNAFKSKTPQYYGWSKWKKWFYINKTPDWVGNYLAILRYIYFKHFCYQRKLIILSLALTVFMLSRHFFPIFYEGKDLRA